MVYGSVWQRVFFFGVLAACVCVWQECVKSIKQVLL